MVRIVSSLGAKSGLALVTKRPPVQFVRKPLRIELVDVGSPGASSDFTPSELIILTIPRIPNDSALQDFHLGCKGHVDMVTPCRNRVCTFISELTCASRFSGNAKSQISPRKRASPTAKSQYLDRSVVSGVSFGIPSDHSE